MVGEILSHSSAEGVASPAAGNMYYRNRLSTFLKFPHRL